MIAASTPERLFCENFVALCIELTVIFHYVDDVHRHPIPPSTAQPAPHTPLRDSR